MYVADTIVAPATPPGRGAVAIIRLSGKEAIAIARTLWRPRKPGELRPRELRLGAIRDPSSGATIDEALCVIFPAPHSLTGEDVVELHCHGGVYLVRRILALTADLGARLAQPGEFARRAYLNGRIDLTRAEAIADLVEARGEEALVRATAQLSGALARHVEGLREKVIGIRAYLEAEIDFADEDLDLPSRAQLASSINELADSVRLLRDSFARGRIAREGVRVALIGKPNAGKSSILNLLLGSNRAIVTPIPGTTRDVIEESISLGPWSVVLSDTAGLRDSVEPIEQLGIARTRAAADEADLLLAVFDSSRPFDSDDAQVVAATRERSGIALLNKCDLAARLDRERLRAEGMKLRVVEFCALTAYGLAELRRHLEVTIDQMAGGPQTDGSPAITRERHRVALDQALAALQAAHDAALASMPPEIVAVDVARAADALASITGAVSTEDVLDAVFSQFCIGK